MTSKELNLESAQSLAEALDLIKVFVTRHTGWKELEVNFDKATLRLKVRELTNTQYGGLLLDFDVPSGFEIYGRTRNVGFVLWDIIQLKRLLVLAKS